MYQSVDPEDSSIKILGRATHPAGSDAPRGGLVGSSSSPPSKSNSSSAERNTVVSSAGWPTTNLVSREESFSVDRRSAEEPCDRSS